MAAERIVGGIGGKLREARERRGISLRQIANATKISVAALDALERNEFSRLPGGIFSRAFVRSYAIEIGLDPDATIQEFVAQYPSDAAPASQSLSEHHGDHHQKFESDGRLASALVKLIVVGIPIVVAVMYFILAARRPHVVPPPAPRQARSAQSSNEAEPSALKPTDAQFVVGVSASAKSFVSATVDGQHTIERELLAGEHEEMTVRREIVLTAGDAGAVRLTLDGAEARPLGKAGEAATLRLNSENFKDYLAPR